MWLRKASPARQEQRRLVIMIFLMTLIMGLCLSAIAVATDPTLKSDLLAHWARRFAETYVVVLPTVLIVAPLARWLTRIIDERLFARETHDPRAAALSAWRANAAGHRGEGFEAWLGHLEEAVSISMPLGAFRGENRGLARARQIYEAIAAARPELTYEAPFRVSQGGETVVIEFEDHGQINGRAYRNRIAASFDMVDGKVAAYREYFGDIDPKIVALMSRSAAAPGPKTIPAASDAEPTPPGSRPARRRRQSRSDRAAGSAGQS